MIPLGKSNSPVGGTSAQVRVRLVAASQSSLVIVPNPCGSAMVAPLGLFRSTANGIAKSVAVGVNAAATCASPIFKPTSKTGVGSGPYDVEVGDFNRDGRRDVAVANYDGQSFQLWKPRACSSSRSLPAQ
jgi:hypothetical protein